MSGAMRKTFWLGIPIVQVMPPVGRDGAYFALLVRITWADLL